MTGVKSEPLMNFEKLFPSWCDTLTMHYLRRLNTARVVGGGCVQPPRAVTGLIF
jgi:hypothetical protein